MIMVLAMYCEYCKACGLEIVGNSTFATMSTHFKRESLKKHCHSSIYKKCRDKCVVSVNSGLIDQAFQRQYDNQSVQEAELIVKFNTAYTIVKIELAFTKCKPMLDSAPDLLFLFTYPQSGT